MKTVFISSTYEDLVEHRGAVWQVLEEFDVAIRGMEQFGARTEAPLQTCLAAVEQSDVYVGIVAFRIGSIDTPSGKSLTQLEYEHALHLEREILIYLADEQVAKVRYTDIDVDPVHREKLKAFKTVLQERHTVSTFSTPDDLAEKLRRDFERYFDPREAEPEEPREEFELTLKVVRRFLLMPKSMAAREVLLRVSIVGEPYPASRSLCKAFNLTYGSTIGVNIKVVKPDSGEMRDFTELYAAGARAEQLLALRSKMGEIDLYARLQFAEEDVRSVYGRFFGYSGYYDGTDDSDPNEYYVPAEGKVILLFSKPVK